MERIASILAVLAVFTSSAPAREYPSGEEILRKVDENLVLDRAKGRSVMIIHGRSGTRTIESEFWVRGQDESYVEYLSPARERGKKMLKLGDKLWTYAPEPADRIITISGHLLRQSVMGIPEVLIACTILYPHSKKLLKLLPILANLPVPGFGCSNYNLKLILIFIILEKSMRFL